jgi:hypothetical protein
MRHQNQKKLAVIHLLFLRVGSLLVLRRNRDGEESRGTNAVELLLEFDFSESPDLMLFATLECACESSEFLCDGATTLATTL